MFHSIFHSIVPFHIPVQWLETPNFPLWYQRQLVNRTQQYIPFLFWQILQVTSRKRAAKWTFSGLFGGILAHANLHGTSDSTMCALGRTTSSVTHMRITSRLVKHDRDKTERCSTSLKQCLDSCSLTLQKLEGWFNLRCITWVAGPWSLPPPTLAQCIELHLVCSQSSNKLWIHVTVDECCPGVTHSTWIFPEFVPIDSNIARVAPLFGTNYLLQQNSCLLKSLTGQGL